MTEINTVVWGLAVGVIISLIFIYFNRVVLGGFVRKLIESDALSVDTALTVDELGYGKNFWIKRALLGSGAFRKIVFEIGDEIHIASEGHSFSARTTPIDLATARFYIAKENKTMAEIRYDRQGASIFTVIASVIIVLVVAYLATLFVPFIISELS
ncbi:MAG: hypothetical protein IJZ03_04060 [Clostridia bacterium]|nr:hypothetical protein [Clostridia bacterium]